MVLALLDLIEQGYFPKGKRIVLLHTGGLQGIGGMLERNLLNSNNWSVPAFT
jgi:1-aminocyclopropane-1-carboxylate deaminase